MNNGYWLNPTTQQSWLVSRHELWVLDPQNAENSKIPPDIMAHLRTLNPASDQDEIRLAALHAGLVRIRERNNEISIQFYVRRERVRQVLWSIYLFLKNITKDKFATLVIDNLALRDSVKIDLNDFEKKLLQDEPILREDQQPEIKDIPLDKELSDKLKRAFGLKSE